MTYDDIDRDILASLGVHFQSAFAGFLPVFFEDQHLDGSPPADYLEVRVEGATIDEIANEQYQVTAEVDIKIVRKKTNNILTIRSDAGKCAESLRQGIPLLHPMPNVDVVTYDPLTYIQVGGLTYVDSLTITTDTPQAATNMGCLTSQSFYGRRHKIEITHHGQLKNKHMLVSTVATTLSILL